MKNLILKCKCGKNHVCEKHEVGAYNVGEVRDESGWHYGACGYSQKSIWLCPECAAKAKSLALQLLEIVKSPYYSLQYLVSKEIREDYCEKNN